MTLPPPSRRRVLAAAALSPLLSMRPGHAQVALPKSLTLLVPQAAGGSNDVFARALAPRLSKVVDASVVVENRPGAGGNIGSAWVAKQAPRDGSVWLATVNSAQSVNPALYRQPGYDPIADFEPVAAIALVPHVIVANTAVPVASLAEVVAAARREPERYSYGSSGNGTFSHLLFEMLKSSQKVRIAHVPYKGVAPALTDLIGGQIHYLVATVPAALPYVKDGRVKPIAVPSRTRAAALPDVPLALDAVPGLVGELWVGLYGPKGVSRDTLDAMRAGVAKVQASADWETFCATQGATALKADAAELASMTRQELDRWGPVVRESGMQID